MAISTYNAKMKGISFEPNSWYDVTVDPGTKNYDLTVILVKREQGVISFSTVATFKFDLRGNSPVILSAMLNRHLSPYVQEVRNVIVERQLRYNAVCATMHYTIMWFADRMRGSIYANSIIELDSKLKTSVHGLKMNKKERKKWSPIFVRQHLSQVWHDQHGLQLLDAEKKPDDYADTIAQYIAWTIKFKPYEQY